MWSPVVQTRVGNVAFKMQKKFGEPACQVPCLEAAGLGLCTATGNRPLLGLHASSVRCLWQGPEGRVRPTARLMRRLACGAQG